MNLSHVCVSFVNAYMCVKTKCRTKGKKIVREEKERRRERDSEKDGQY